MRSAFVREGGGELEVVDVVVEEDERRWEGENRPVRSRSATVPFK